MTTQRNPLLDKVAAREVVLHGEDPAVAKDIYRLGVDQQGRASTVLRDSEGNEYRLSTETDEFLGTITKNTVDQLITFTGITNYVYNWIFINDGNIFITYKFEEITNPVHTLNSGEIESWELLQGTRVYVSNPNNFDVAIRIKVSGN